MSPMGPPRAAGSTHSSRYARLPRRAPQEHLKQSGRAWFSKAKVTCARLSASEAENMSGAADEFVRSAVTRFIHKIPLRCFIQETKSEVLNGYRSRGSFDSLTHCTWVQITGSSG